MMPVRWGPVACEEGHTTGGEPHTVQHTWRRAPALDGLLGAWQHHGVERRVALVTNVCEYAGPGSSQALAGDGFIVACHDRRFSDDQSRRRFAAQHEGWMVLEAQDVDGVVDATFSRFGRIDVVVSNDFIVPSRSSFDDATLDEYRRIIEDLMVVPFRIAKAVVPHMSARGAGSLIFITSAAAVRTAAGVLMYASARAGCTSMAAALAKELGPANIQVNSIGPNFFKSDTYFPDERIASSAPLRRVIESQVPIRRLGTQDEMGALISLLASQRAMPITGQFIGFSGGWLP
jgi:3-oxoacyl-[acyl-carrier protein] reductase